MSKNGVLLSRWVFKNIKAQAVHLEEFHPLGTNVMRLEQPWHVPDNRWLRQPTECKIVAGIHLHHPILSQDQGLQNAYVRKAELEPQNAILPEYFPCLIGDME